MRALVLVCVLASAGCSDDGVASAQDAMRAYLGLDSSIDKAINLGFDGFNAASSANIAPQEASGTHSGTLTVTGQVDQGSSANKGMRLSAAYVNYSDDGLITYDANASPPALEMMLKNIPNGTVNGTLAGTVTMHGQETGALTLRAGWHNLFAHSRTAA
jgi:hypothetical protein